MTNRPSRSPTLALAAVLFLALAVAAAGCAESETAIVLDLELGGLEVPGDVDLLRVQLLGVSGQESTALDFDAAELGRHEELSLAVVRSDESIGGVQISAQAFGPMPEEAPPIAGTPQSRVSLGVRSEWVDFVAGSVVHHEIAFDATSDCADRDGDLYWAGPDCAGAGWDCDDLDGEVYPGAPEACDGRDADCDGSDAWLQEVGFEDRVDACEGWMPVGLCELFDVECVDGEWACPYLSLPAEDDCVRLIDMNCDGVIDCGCDEGDIAAMPCTGTDPDGFYFECGTEVCRGDVFVCEPPAEYHYESEYCLDDSMACGEYGMWTCAQDPGTSRYAFVCESAGEPVGGIETCNDGYFVDDDCDGLVDGDDVESCPLGAGIGWSCVATEGGARCLEVESGTWLCLAPLRLTLELPEGLPPDALRQLRVQASYDNVYSDFCGEAVETGGTGMFPNSVTFEVSCSLHDDLELPITQGFVTYAQQVLFWIGAEVMDTAGMSVPPAAGSYWAVETWVTLPDGGDTTLLDPDARVEIVCEFSPPVGYD